MRLILGSALVAMTAGLLWGVADEASAQVRANVQVRGNRGGYNLYGQRPWFGNPAVRKQLKIDDNQYATLNKSYTQYWTPYNQTVTALPADLEEQQRQQKIAAAYGTFHQGFNESTGKVLTDAEIRNRYNQLNLQYQGYAAFNDPQIQTRLKLTDQQQQNFNRYYTDWNKQMNTYAGEYATDPNSVNKQWGDNWKQTRSRINETLTPDQRKSWTEMTGEAYDFPADVYFDNGEGREGAGRDNPPRNPAPGAGPRENPPRNPAPGAAPRENPPRSNP